MSHTKKLVTLIRELVQIEVQKEVNKIFIKEGVKAITQNRGIVPEVLAKPIPKKTKSKEVSYTKNPTLNKILNETAQTQEFEEYPSMGEYDTSNMAELLGYGGTPMGGDDETKRKVSAVQTAKSAGVDPTSPEVEDVMNAMSRDYRGVMKAIDKKQGK
tara:strand:- start:2444 stop:2917 length:474 start_codon:yes stop_codon:yes gene_type:complete